MRKIPVKIVEIKDIHGNKHISIMLDISHYIDNVDTPAKLEEFKKLYLKTIEEAKKLYQITKSKNGNNSKYYWRIGKLLQNFNKKIENTFVITNYYTALERDFGVSASHIGVILKFAKLFKEEEVLENIQFSVYMELIWKSKQLKKLGFFEEEKARLLKMAKKGNVSPHKKYREGLKELIKSYTMSNNT